MEQTMKIVEMLTQCGFILIDKVDNDNFYFKQNGTLVSVVSPHSGSEFMILVRADFDAIFDKWGNSSFEWLLESSNAFESETLFTLLGMVYAAGVDSPAYRKFIVDNNE